MYIQFSRSHRFLSVVLLAALLLVFVSGSALAQSAEYKLNVQRTFGFSSGSQIKGNFSLSIVGPADTIQSVTYQLDGQTMATIDQPNFKFSFKTEDYPTGWHDLSAVVLTKDQLSVTTPVRRFQFVTSAEEATATRNIVVPLISGIVILMILGVGAQMLFLRGKHSTLPLGAPRTYGIWGGAICPRCKRPFSIHMWAVNAGFSKFDRCDYCGKWSLVKRRSLDELRAAEQAELAETQTGAVPEFAQQAEETLRRKLDESRYIDRQ